jgi:hypothetical protein
MNTHALSTSKAAYRGSADRWGQEASGASVAACRRPMRVRKPLYFAAALAALLGADALVPRPANLPPALLSREQLIALVRPVPPPSVEEVPAPEPEAPEPPPPVAAGAPDARVPARVRAPLSDREPFAVTEDPRWEELEAKLARRVVGKPEVVRVVHLGDSEIANEMVAKTLRRHFVARYGEAGPGFALALAPWNWYLREGFHHQEPDGFVARSFALVKDGSGNFGPGGVAFDSRGKRATAEVKIDSAGHPSCEVALYYGVQPGGGALEVLAGGKPVGQVETDGAATDVARRDFHLSPCPKTLAVRTQSGPVRVFGWSVEWGQPGVVWSTVGVVSASATHFLRYNDGLIGRALASLEPDLVVVAHGLNFVQKPGASQHDEGEGLRRLLAELKERVPHAACLVMSPYPIAYTENDKVEPSLATLPLAKLQRKIAREAGCAFLDRLKLAGGPRQALKWLNGRPRILSGDYVHLTEPGSEKVGTDVANALLTHLKGPR